MITPKPFPLAPHNFWRFMFVYVVGYVVVHGVVLGLGMTFGGPTENSPIWHWVVGNLCAIALTDIAMALGGWVAVTNALFGGGRRALVVALGFVLTFALLSQHMAITAFNASLGRVVVWVPWVWYLYCLASEKPVGPGSVDLQAK